MAGSYLERKKIWEARFEELKNYQGTIESYCKERSIPTSAFYLWRKRLSPKSSALKKKLRPEKGSSFLPVAVESSSAPGLVEMSPASRDLSLPDPKWVADVLSNLLRSLS